MFTKLLGFQFKIQYKKGVDNRVANALSRRPHHETHLLALSQQQPTWLQDISDLYQDSTEAQELLTKLAVQTESEDKYSLHDGLIHYKGRLWLPSGIPFLLKLLDAFHTSPIGGHSGIPVTLRRLK